MSFPEFQVTPVGEPARSLPKLELGDICMVCREGRLVRTTIRGDNSYFGVKWLIKCAIGGAFLVAAAAEVSKDGRKDDQLVAYAFFGGLFLILVLFAVLILRGMQPKKIYKCFQCGEEMSDKEYRRASQNKTAS